MIKNEKSKNDTLFQQQKHKDPFKEFLKII